MYSPKSLNANCSQPKQFPLVRKLAVASLTSFSQSGGFKLALSGIDWTVHPLVFKTECCPHCLTVQQNCLTVQQTKDDWMKSRGTKPKIFRCIFFTVEKKIERFHFEQKKISTRFVSASFKNRPLLFYSKFCSRAHSYKLEKPG